MATLLKQFHRGTNRPEPFFFMAEHGRMPKPNIRYRQSVRDTTDAYYAEVQRRAVGIDLDAMDRRAKLRRALKQAAWILGPLGLLVAVLVLR